MLCDFSNIHWKICFSFTSLNRMTFPKYLNLEDFISEDLEEVSIRLVAAE